MPGYGDHFAQVAASYDSLRREATDEVVDWLIVAGRLEDAHDLLDVGCGTGATTKRLTARLGLTAVGVDSSREMLSAGGPASVPGCRFVQGRAEELPFGDRSFDRVLMQTVVHLLDRPSAFPEARRVLVDDAALVIASVDPAGIDAFWLADWFPSWAEIDRGRFPAAETLAAERERHDFGTIGLNRLSRRLELSREHALAMLRARFASSFALIDEAEYEQGLARAERDMPETFESTLELIALTAWAA